MIEVKVPTVGESIQEVQIGQWLKREGDWIAKDDNLVDLETEKASVQVPAPVSGVLRKIVKQAEEFAAVGDVIAEIEPSEKPAAGAAASSGGNGSAAAAPAAKVEEARVMPAAKRIMEENQLSATDVSPTGPGGRVLKEDAQRAVSAKSNTPPALPQLHHQHLHRHLHRQLHPHRAGLVR